MWICNDILNRDPNNSLALFVAGQAMLDADKHGLAFNIFKRVVELEPNQALAWNALGGSVKDVFRVNEAIGYFKKSIECAKQNLTPDNERAVSAALINLGQEYLNTAQPQKAIQFSKEALKYDGDSQAAINNIALGKLMLHDWSGWEEYDQSLGNKYRVEKQYTLEDEGRWRGGSGKNVVIYGEQGLGDEILFMSMANKAIADCNKIYIDCDSRLEGLFQRSFPEAEVHGTRNKQPLTWPHNASIDARCAMGGLGEFYARSDEAISGEPYLTPCPIRSRMWAEGLRTLSNKPKIGIAWNGGHEGTGDYFRSLDLRDLLPILSQDATFISLEYRDPRAQIDEFKNNTGIDIHHFPYATNTMDYDNDVALVSALDLVISVTTTVVHAAGAIGKECWCLTPVYPNWRFGLEGGIIWHNSVHLYRQTSNWEAVIEKVAGDLHERLSDIHRSRPQAAGGV